MRANWLWNVPIFFVIIGFVVISFVAIGFVMLFPNLLYHLRRRKREWILRERG